jgi:hypothetical protein
MMETATVRRGREGSRWINERPTSQEVAEWFRSVPLHDGMDHEKYVGGITLIQGVEKADEIVGYDGDGRPVIVEDVRNVTFTPYMKVETRVAYFHDYVDRLGADDRYAEVGTVPIIEPITPQRRRPARAAARLLRLPRQRAQGRGEVHRLLLPRGDRRAPEVRRVGDRRPACHGGHPHPRGPRHEGRAHARRSGTSTSTR